MKPSEFYEKYWLVNGKKPPPLTDKEKEWLDGVSRYDHITAMFFRKRRRPISINIDYLKEDMKKTFPIKTED